MPQLSLEPVSIGDDVLLEKMGRSHVVDRIATLRIQEESTYRVRDYITESAAHRKRASKPVDSDCRVKMCEWCYQVVDFCKFRRETVAIGMTFLDRYLCTPKGRTALCNRKEYQLAAMTALYIAIKLHEPLEMETALLADLSRGCYTEMEFVDMEQVILQAIHWRVNGPTVFAFVAHFLALLPSAVHESVAKSIMDYARFQTELVVAEQSFATIKPSELALAAIFNAVEGIDTSLFPLKTQAKFLRYIEHYGELVGTHWRKHVEKIQSKLSHIVSKILVAEWDEIEEQFTREEMQKNKQEKKNDKPSSGLKNQSPVSVAIMKPSS